MANPYGMDEECTRCTELTESRRTIVHGYGDVTADFFFVCESPSEWADTAGHPIDPSQSGYGLTDILAASGFLTENNDVGGNPILDNAFITHLTRCRHPHRSPRRTEIDACEPFLNAELRTINPEIILPIGPIPLESLAEEFTTHDVDAQSMGSLHATELRGRGFELIPLIEPENMTEADFHAAIERIRGTLRRDYRQTKGRQDP